MTSAKTIKAQHPKNARTIVQITKGRSNLPEKARRVV
jgi:hypothetical protein